jgi:predicted transcriptional regulator
MAKLPAKTNAAATNASSRAASTRAASAPIPRVDNRSPETIPPADREAVQEGAEQADRGEFATDGEMRAVFRRFRP